MIDVPFMFPITALFAPPAAPPTRANPAPHSLCRPTTPRSRKGDVMALPAGATPVDFGARSWGV